uniref:Uncharacterized protein n=1 Tax=Romanomermis culicivorax TaxID=13658 RepID=A0A915KM38_ROMCU
MLKYYGDITNTMVLTFEKKKNIVHILKTGKSVILTEDMPDFGSMNFSINTHYRKIMKTHWKEGGLGISKLKITGRFLLHTFCESVRRLIASVEQELMERYEIRKLSGGFFLKHSVQL